MGGKKWSKSLRLKERFNKIKSKKKNKKVKGVEKKLRERK